MKAFFEKGDKGMRSRNFRELCEAQWDKRNFVCVGLDSEIEKIPKTIRAQAGDIQFNFNRRIIENTYDVAGFYKPNIAFYAAYGTNGIASLKKTIGFIHEIDPEKPVILDCKRGDIGNTNIGYIREAFEYLEVDAMTVSPYLGIGALKPFLDRIDKGIIILCRTSNPEAGEFQDVTVHFGKEEFDALEREGFSVPLGLPLYQYVALHAAYKWNKNGNCALVVGATCPAELREVRKIAGDMPFLIPGVGTQGGDVEKTVKSGRDSRGLGIIINSSRGIIFANDSRAETLKLHNKINR